MSLTTYRFIITCLRNRLLSESLTIKATFPIGNTCKDKIWREQSEARKPDYLSKHTDIKEEWETSYKIHQPLMLINSNRNEGQPEWCHLPVQVYVIIGHVSTVVKYLVYSYVCTHFGYVNIVYQNIIVFRLSIVSQPNRSNMGGGWFIRLLCLPIGNWVTLCQKGLW